jgi:hypothetical protein
MIANPSRVDALTARTREGYELQFDDATCGRTCVTSAGGNIPPSSRTPRIRPMQLGSFSLSLAVKDLETSRHYV